MPYTCGNNWKATNGTLTNTWVPHLARFIGPVPVADGVVSRSEREASGSLSHTSDRLCRNELRS